VIVVASGNSENSDVHNGPDIESYPQLFANEGLGNMVVVGATDKYSRAALFSQLPLPFSSTRKNTNARFDSS
jgi:hypothetical protein